MENYIRCFICIEIPKELKDKILDIFKKIKQVNPDIKFVEEENLHITLAFLTKNNERGIPKEDIYRINDIIRNTKVYDSLVKIKGISIIPSVDYMRVISFDIISDDLERIRNEINNKLREIGISPKSNPCHFTIGRVRSSKNKQELIKVLNELKQVEIGFFKIDKICFKQSKITPKGPVYTNLN